jgi:hypothetical protein
MRGGGEIHDCSASLFALQRRLIMKKFSFLSIITFLAVVISVPAAASSVQRYFRDSKYPTQAAIEKQTFPTPAATGTADVLSANAGATSAAAATVTTFVTQPDVPRNLVITPGGTTTDVEACDVTVTGTNFFGQSISEVFSFVANASSASTGNKAFKTVTSIGWAADCESGAFGATWSVGFGKKLGMKRCMAAAGDYVWSTFDGAYESTRGTAAANTTAIESNTFTPNGTLDGAKDAVLYFVQNFRCFP